MPIPQPPASAGQSVQVFDEMEYICKPGDTFASISKDKLLSENYAKALQRHNQQHARASKRVEETGQLTAGDRIFIPHAYILEQRYGDTIPKSAAAPSNTAPAVVPASATSVPQPGNR